MIHPRTLKTPVVVLLMHAGMLMLIQLDPITPRPAVEEPLEVQAHIIPATPKPIEQSESPKQQPVKQGAPEPANIVRPVAQPKPMPIPMPTPMLPPSDSAPVVPAAPPAPPAPTPKQAPAPTPVSSGPISVGINGTQCSKPPLVYPSTSQKMGEEGRVMVKISIDTTGKVTNVTVTLPPSSPRLDRAAADAARAIKCSPYRQNGRAVSVVASKPFVFKLDN